VGDGRCGGLSGGGDQERGQHDQGDESFHESSQ
jgi:hypothetical protein